MIILIATITVNNAITKCMNRITHPPSITSGNHGSNNTTQDYSKAIREGGSALTCVRPSQDRAVRTESGAIVVLEE